MSKETFKNFTQFTKPARDMKGIIYRNSHFAHSNAAGSLPSPAQKGEWEMVGHSYNIANELDGVFVGGIFENGQWDFSETDYKENYMPIQYRMWITFLGDLWDYNEEFLNALTIGKYKVEDLLFSQSCVLVRDQIVGTKEPTYWLLPFTEDDKGILDKDVYDRPTRIKITSANDYWNNHAPIEKENFVVMKNNPLQWNKIIENNSFFKLDYAILCAINDNKSQAQTHYQMLTKPSWDPEADTTASTINEQMKSRQLIHKMNIKMGDKGENGTNPQDELDGNDFEEFSKSLMKMDFANLMPDLWELHLNVEAMAYRTLGIPINSNAKKRERQITGEIDVEQAIPNSQRHAMFYCREYALKEANKKWNTNFGITLNEEVEQTPANVVEEPTEDKGEQDNGESNK